ncbi:MAG: response regulator transcription factor [Sediminibacterium sp.]|nr:response regulator transcription factor [Sediminibacterium sp.]
MVNNKISILISDDQSIYRAGLKQLLANRPGIGTITESINETEMIGVVRNNLPDVILIGVNYQRNDGIAALSGLFAAFPESRVVVLTSSPINESIRQMVELGALGHVTKFAGAEEIHEAVQAVYKREPYFCLECAQRFSEMISRKDPEPSQKVQVFSEREREIIRLICKELTSKEIANVLNLSKRTIEGHRSRIMNKTGAKSTAGIIIYAVEHKIYECME